MTRSATIPGSREDLKIHILFFFILLILSAKMTVFAQDNLHGNKMVSDNYGNTYVAGNFSGSTLHFGKYTLKNFGGSDIFLAKYDSNGKIVWAKNIGGNSDEKIISLKVDGSGNLSISASSNSNLVNIDNEKLNNNYSKATFNAQLNTNGNLFSAKVESLQRQVISNSSNLNQTSDNDTTISLVSPQAGDNWKVGTKGIIKWNSQNIKSVLIELSTDSGVTWKKIYTSSSFDFSNQYQIVVPNTPSDSCLVKISDYYNSNVSDTSGLFSISGVLYWEIKENNYSSVLKDVDFLDTSTGWAAGFNGLIYTTDKGETWSPKLEGYGLLDIFFLNNNVGWTVGLSGSIFKTTNGGEDWTKLNNNFDFHFEKVYFADDSTGYVIGKNYFLKTTDGGSTWASKQLTEHILQTMYFINKDTGWVAGNEGVILKTTDGGLTWNNEQMSGTDYGTLTSIYFIDENTGWASGSGLDVDGGVILKTVDGGSNWSLQHSGYNTFIYSIHFRNASHGWAVGDEGIMFNTTNGGANWELQGSGTFAGLNSVNLESSQNGWSVGNDGMILKYINNVEPSELPVELTNFEANNSGNYVELKWTTATEINNKGFEIERKTGSGWEIIGFVNGKGTTTLQNIYSFKDNLKDMSGMVHVSYRLKQVDYDGTFKYSKEVKVQVNSSPVEYSLMQNYPNPFNPSTTIKFSVKENTHVLLKVYDILGREVSTLINEEKPAGTYSVNFNAAAAELSSGTYFYRLSAGNMVLTKKMLLLK